MTDTPEIGETVEFRKTMTVAEQAMFTGISGNLHPLYVDEVHAGGPCLAFELAVAALATTALAELGGPERRLSALHLDFPEPARVGDTIAAEAQVVEAEDETLRCRITCRRDDGTVVAEGSAELSALARED
jgi:3-hydroxybutyryl-CoA dehydratase